MRAVCVERNKLGTETGRGGQVSRLQNNSIDACLTRRRNRPVERVSLFAIVISYASFELGICFSIGGIGIVERDRAREAENKEADYQRKPLVSNTRLCGLEATPA